MQSNPDNSKPEWKSPIIPGITPELIEAAKRAAVSPSGQPMIVTILDPESYVMLVALAQTGFCFGKMDGMAANKARSMLSALCMHAGNCDPALADFLSKSMQGLMEAKAMADEAESRRKQAKEASRNCRPGLLSRIWSAIWPEWER